jgi:hypothetical protein
MVPVDIILLRVIDKVMEPPGFLAANAALHNEFCHKGYITQFD